VFHAFLGWLVSLLPKDALIVEEEAWNAYPYTRTRYTCPFVDKFSIDIETVYFNDVGDSENVFKMSASELRNNLVGRYILYTINRVNLEKYCFIINSCECDARNVLYLISWKIDLVTNKL